MEKDVAILIADLSGYTALTETHGAAAAADMVERYLKLVNHCLVGDSQLQERTGDEVMILSSSPDQLLATALLLLQSSHTEENFLLLHGGLHYGKLLKRENSYFGTAINLASRIAAKATAGSIWCSQHFLAALSGTAPAAFAAKGKHSFKNLSEEAELFEVQQENKKTLYIDPVCCMLILDEKNAITHPSLPGTYFCSVNCAALFTSRKLTLTAGEASTFQSSNNKGN